VTRDQLIPLLDQYRAGLDAELMLLHRLQALALEQRRVSQTGSVVDLHTTVDDRDRVLATLVKVEHELKGVRQQLQAGRQWLADLPAYQEIVERHTEAADLVADIIGVDRDSIEALKEAEQARRIAAQSLEQGESTLAAYRRVVSPGLSSATLVNRRG
jgi:uncharacterized protein YhaN